MLNNIRINQSLEEITLNVSVVANVPDVIRELEEKIPRLSELYQGENLPIRITGKLFTEGEITSIKKLINKYLDVKIIFDDPSELLGLHAIKRIYESETQISETKYLYTSLRSGQREDYSGSIVIVGDVNSGAEVVASGNIIVVGTLRGLAHAGADGNIKAIIAANEIVDTQIRIANLVKEVPAEGEKCPIYCVKDKEIVKQ